MKKGHFVIILSVAIIFTLALGVHSHIATGSPHEQKTHTLDLENYSFRYETSEFLVDTEERSFNETIEFDFEEDEGLNQTFHIELPKNAMVEHASMEVEGMIKPLYENYITGTRLRGMSTGDLNNDGRKEIVSGSGYLKDDPDVYVFNGTTGEEIGGFDEIGELIRDTAIGQVTDENQVVAGDDEGELHLIEDIITGPNITKSVDLENDVRVVEIVELEGDVKVLAGAGNTLFFLDNNLEEVNKFTTEDTVRTVALGKIGSDNDEKIVVGADKLYVLNQTGHKAWSKNLDTTIRGLDIGNVTGSGGNEIAVGSDENITLLEPDDQNGAEVVWEFPADKNVFSVSIGNVIREGDLEEKNEVVAGSEDEKIRVLNYGGDLEWKFEAEEEINTVVVDDLTDISGSEIVSGEHSIYAFNSQYFPINLSVGSGNVKWTYDGVLRENTTVQGIEKGINNNIKACAPDEQDLCNIPIDFESEHEGRLGAYGLNVTYTYNASDLIAKEEVEGKWSRTSDIYVNESVGNESIKLNFEEDPAVDVIIEDIKLDPNSGICDFNGTQYIGEHGVCPIDDFTLYSDGGKDMPSVLFWENGTMSSDKPVLMNQSDLWETTDKDNYTQRRNLTIWNKYDEDFRNVTANVTIDYEDVVGREFLMVEWGEDKKNITPKRNCSDGFENIKGFYVCKDSDDGNRVFEWKQPNTSSARYMAGGYTIEKPEVSNLTVAPEEDYWGENFTFSANVSGEEGHNANVTLWIKPNQMNEWIEKEEKMVTLGGDKPEKIEFKLGSNSSWAGENKFRFEYFDHDEDGGKFHSPEKTEEQGPVGKRRHAEIVHVKGNNTEVNRTEETELVVKVNDTNEGKLVNESVSVSFWIDNGNGNWSEYSEETDSGYANLTFKPDEKYTVGEQKWKAGIFNDEYYKEENTSELNIDIHGFLNIDLLEPEEGSIVFRNQSETFSAQLVDSFKRNVNLENYICDFEIGGSDGEGETDKSGFCSVELNPGCNLDISNETIETNLKTDDGEDKEFYTVINDSDSYEVEIWDSLTTNIERPVTNDLYFTNSTIELNSTVWDNCGNTAPGDLDYGDVTWEILHDMWVELTLEEDEGLERDGEPYTIQGSYLEDLGIDLERLEVNETNVFHEGKGIPVDVRPWTNESMVELNYSREHIDGHMEIVFPVDLEPKGSGTYRLAWNTTNPQPEETYNFIRNGGFEGGHLDGWEPEIIDYGNDEKSHSISNESKKGNKSLYMRAEEGKTVSIEQQLPRNFSGSIIMQYRAWGSYNETDDYAKIIAGNHGKELGLDHISSREERPDFWNMTKWNPGSEIENVSVEIYNTEEGLHERHYGHLEIDYICISEDGESCKNYHSGGSLERDSYHADNITTDRAYNWSLEEERDVGIRRISARAFGEKYIDGTDFTDFRLHGWSRVEDADIISDACWYSEKEGEGKWICAAEENITTSCLVYEKHNNVPALKHNVELHNDTEFVYERETGREGTSLFNLTTPEAQEDKTYNLTCKIKDDWDAFYNASEDNEKTVSYTVRDGNTEGNLSVEPTNVIAENITRLSNYTFGLSVTMNNTGDGTMLSPQIDIENPDGFHIEEMECESIGIGENCSEILGVNITQEADATDGEIKINSTWINEDGSLDYTVNKTSTTVENNTKIKILESNITAAVSAGFEGEITNFTVDAFGNTELENVTMNITGQDSDDLNDWFGFNHSDLTDIKNTSGLETIEKAENETVGLWGSIPIEEGGTFLGNITANATGSECEPMDKCSETVPLNLTVDMPDWYRKPRHMNTSIGTGQEPDTIGHIEITNNLDINQSFSMERSGNGTDYIHIEEDGLEVGNGTSEKVRVYHSPQNDEYEEGVHRVNISIENLDGKSPSELNTTVMLEVVPLTVDIKDVYGGEDVGEGEFAGPLNSSDRITVHANVTKDKTPVEDTEGYDIGIEVGEIGDSYRCKTTGNKTEDLWKINCTAPEIQGNPIINDIFVEVTEIEKNISSQARREDSVIYYDVIPPSFSKVRVDSVEYSEAGEEIEIEVDITDNTGVNESWMNIDYNGTDELDVEGLKPDETDGDIYTFVYENEAFPVGDYDITVWANDTGKIKDPEGNTLNESAYGGQVNSTKGWFSVYEPMDVSMNMTDPLGKEIEADFKWYRPDRHDIIIHEWTGAGHFEREIHKREYDLGIEVFDYDIMFKGLDANDSFYQQKDSEILEEPLSFDALNLSDKEIEDELAIKTPGNYDDDHIVDGVNAIAVERAPYLDEPDHTIFNVSYPGIFDPENRSHKVLECPDWNIEKRYCESEEMNILDTEVHHRDNIMSFEPYAGSLYIIVREAKEEDGNGNGGGGGNGIGELPEEDDPFPFDYDTNLDDDRLLVGESRGYWIMLTNEIGEKIEVNMSVYGGLEEYFTFENDTVEIDGGRSDTFGLNLELDEEVESGSYSHNLILESDGRERSMPFEIEVFEEADDELVLDIEIIQPRIDVGDNLTVRLELKGQGTNDKFDVGLVYLAKDLEGNKTVGEHRENISFEEAYSDIKEVPLPEDMEVGNYRLEVWAEFNNRAVRDMAMFQVMQPFWATTAGQILLFLGVPIAIIVMIIGSFRVREKYKELQEEKEEKQRYLFPVDYSSIPQKTEDSFWIGKLAAKNKRAYFNPDDLKTHVLVAGATGAGKSVGASIFAEEALEKDIPVVVFDPTAQWTGFVKPCEDEDLLKYYSKLNMDKNRRKSYPGMIHKMDDPEKDIDFEELMKEGEITVFTLHDLTIEEFDSAVRNIIDSMFDVNWEESEDLKMVVVFDEVHRLLEKYGGKGGYVALERACREFRKWGIGIIMCSQVLSDFKEAIEGNVLTDVQFNTKAMQDIKKAKEKYGEKYAKRITRQGIGVSMIQNAQYNDGKPWFMRFRPTWHNPHKLEKEKLEKYQKYSEKLEKIEKKIDSMEEEGKDVFDLRTSMKMAKNKLKSGNFRMTEIYIDSLEEKID